MPQPWVGRSDKDLHAAAEAAAKEAERDGFTGEIDVTIQVTVHKNAPGETGPNPISSYIVTLGGAGG